MAFRATDTVFPILWLGRASRLTRAGGPGPEREALIAMDYWA